MHIACRGHLQTPQSSKVLQSLDRNSNPGRFKIVTLLYSWGWPFCYFLGRQKHTLIAPRCGTYLWLQRISANQRSSTHRKQHVSVSTTSIVCLGDYLQATGCDAEKENVARCRPAYWRGLGGSAPLYVGAPPTPWLDCKARYWPAPTLSGSAHALPSSWRPRCSPEAPHHAPAVGVGLPGDHRGRRRMWLQGSSRRRHRGNTARQGAAARRRKRVTARTPAALRPCMHCWRLQSAPCFGGGDARR